MDTPQDVYDVIDKTGKNSLLGTTVSVAGIQGTVREADVYTDSCFIEMSQRPSVGSLQQTQGPLLGKCPTQYNPANYEGISTQGSTKIKGYDLSLLSLVTNTQKKVYTEPDTDPGDSGAALVDENSYVLGFSHNRTGIGEYPEWSSWMWAQAVYDALGIGTTI